MSYLIVLNFIIKLMLLINKLGNLSGIRKVYYYSDKHHDRPSTIASRFMLKKAGVEVEQYIPKQQTVTINFSDISRKIDNKNSETKG